MDAGDDDIVRGQLILASGSASVRLRQEQDGCGMAAGDMVQSDYTLTRSQRGQGWIGVGMVKAHHAVMHASPAADTKRVPYLVAFDAVAVLARQPGWVQVRYLGNAKPVTGWLAASDLATENWPKTIRTP